MRPVAGDIRMIEGPLPRRLNLPMRIRPHRATDDRNGGVRGRDDLSGGARREMGRRPLGDRDQNRIRIGTYAGSPPTTFARYADSESPVQWHA